MAGLGTGRANAGRRGSALIASLFVVVAVSVMSVAYLQLSLSKNREGRASVDAKRAFYLAEAGLSESFTAIRMGRSGNVGSEDEPAQFATGVYWVVAKEQENMTCLLTSTGLCGTGRSSLSVVVDKTESSVQSLGVFGDEDITVGEGALIDSYDSRFGAYDEQGYDPDWYEAREQEADEGVAEEPGEGRIGALLPSGSTGVARSYGLPLGAALGSDLGGPAQSSIGGGGVTVTTTEDAAENDFTLAEWADAVEDMEDAYRLPRSSKITSNGDITILGAPEGSRPTRVLGSLRPGPDGTVTTESGALVSGGTAPAEEHTLLPVIEVPELPDRGDKTLGRGFVLEDLEAGYGTLQAPAGTALVLRGPLKLTVEALVIEAGAQLQIDTTNGPIEVYATEYFGLEEGSLVVSHSTTPEEAVFIVTAHQWIDRDGDGTPDSPAVLAASGEMHSVLFAPHADLSIDNDLEYFGSIAGRRVTVGPNAKLHFDLALESVAGGPLTIPKLVAWRLVELPNARIVRQKLDPILWLKAQGVTPPKSDQAYRDKWLNIQFTCYDGHTHKYDGPKHLFKYRLAASTLSETITVPPAGRIGVPATDFMDPVYGHAAQEALSPFRTVP